MYTLLNIITVGSGTNENKIGSTSSRHRRDVNGDSVPLRNYDLSMYSDRAFRRNAVPSYSSVNCIRKTIIPPLNMRSSRSLEKSGSDYPLLRRHIPP